MNEQLKVLILEDNPADAELVERELSNAGLLREAICVETRADFVEQLHAFQPDIVVADYTLPSFNGMEALEIAGELCPDVPIVMCTGSVDEETAVECLKRGAADYVLKAKPGRLVPAVAGA